MAKQQQTDEAPAAAPTVVPEGDLVKTDAQTIAELQASNGVLREALEEATKLFNAQHETIGKLVARVDELEKKNAELAKKKPAKAVPEGNYAVFCGETYPIIGDYRADNTFHHVKTRDCDEGLTLLAIPRPH